MPPRSRENAAPGPAPLAVGEAREVPWSLLVSEVYRDAPPLLRARLLESLLRPVRPLALAAIAAGAFGGYLHRDRWPSVSVSLEDATRFSAEQVLELARYLEQFRPEVLVQAAAALAENPATAGSVAGAMALSTLLVWLRGALLREGAER